MTRTIPITALLLLGIAGSLLASRSASAPAAEPFVEFHGRVVDDGDGAPLAGVQIAVHQTGEATLTAADGTYRMLVSRAGLPGDDVTLVAQSLGYETSTITVSIAADLVRADFRLRAAGLALDEVAVTQEAATAQRREIGAPSASVGAAANRSMISPMAPPPPAGHRYGGGDWNTEAYEHFVDNAFLAATIEPLSTFSIDVDRASYGNVRRFLRDGELPPVDAVRTEELINYFPYDYPTRSREHPFAVTTEVAPAPWRPEHRLLRIGLASPAVDTSDLPPANLVFLIDVSGSMMTPDKLPLVKRSLRMLVDQLREQDRVSIVVYAGAAGLVLPPTPGTDRHRILHAIEMLEAGGSTAGGEGIRLAYDVARRSFVRGGNNRVILATDGDFNVGVSSDAEMIRLVEGRRDEGTFLTVLGFGTGNLKDSKMEQMADHGNGNYAYIDSLLEARKTLVNEMGGTLLTVAKDVKLQVEFNPARVAAYRLIGYENRLLAAQDFNDDTKDAGELGAGHTVTALYEIIPVGADTEVEVPGVDPLRYQAPASRPHADPSAELAFVRVRYKRPTAETSLLLEQPVRDGTGEPSVDMTFASAVAGFGMLLRESEHAGSLTADRVIALARAGLGADRGGYRADFIELVELYRHVADGDRRREGW